MLAVSITSVRTTKLKRNEKRRRSVASYPKCICLAVNVFLLIHCFTCRTHNKKAARAQFQMMPIGTPKVPYRTPGEGTWQWVDLWNALVSYRSSYVIFAPTEAEQILV